MKNTVFIRKNREQMVVMNRVSGHTWVEEGSVKNYEVVSSRWGHISTHRSLSKAEEARCEWQAFYDKHDPEEA